MRVMGYWRGNMGCGKMFEERVEERVGGKKGGDKGSGNGLKVVVNRR